MCKNYVTHIVPVPDGRFLTNLLICDSNDFDVRFLLERYFLNCQNNRNSVLLVRWIFVVSN